VEDGWENRKVYNRYSGREALLMKQTPTNIELTVIRMLSESANFKIA
jgi:hypothetical protein